jgi:hypothetical protein
MLVAAQMEDAMAADPAACRQYADQAIQQNQQNVQLDCGFDGPRWSSDHDGHYHWCLQQPAAAVGEESMARDDRLDECRNRKTNAFGEGRRLEPEDSNGAHARARNCDDYAKVAVSQNQENEKLGCGLTGQRWSNDFDGHRFWCVSAADAELATERAARQVALDKCKANGVSGIQPVRLEVLPRDGGRIEEKYKDLGGGESHLGPPVSGLLPASNGGSRRDFRNGSIYWHVSVGAHELHGAIRDRWRALGGEAGLLGYPTTDEIDTPDGLGRYNNFQHGSLVWYPRSGVHQAAVLPDYTKFSKSPDVPDLIERWAPVIYHDTGSFWQADVPTTVDYDGNWMGRDNASNLVMRPSIAANVYYSVVVTRTHYLVGYYLYHAKDTTPWHKGGHEHDMEGALLAIDRKRHELDVVLTNVHGRYVPYLRKHDMQRPAIRRRSGDYGDDIEILTMLKGEFPAPTLALGVEAETHAVWGRWNTRCVLGGAGTGGGGCDASHGGDGLCLVYAGRADQISRADIQQYPRWKKRSYALCDIRELWARAVRPEMPPNPASTCGQSEPQATFACQSQHPWDVLNASGEDKGDMPWVWGTSGVIDHACRGANWALDPAAILSDWFAWDAFSLGYDINLFRNDLACDGGKSSLRNWRITPKSGKGWSGATVSPKKN